MLFSTVAIVHIAVSFISTGQIIFLGRHWCWMIPIIPFVMSIGVVYHPDK